MTDLPEHVSIWAELADTDHELRHVDVRGVRTRVLRAGSGPDLVLLHGTGGHLEAYARDIAGLARDFRVTAYDMVGHGWSGLPDQPYTIDVLCDHLTGLLDALDIGTAHLSGESLGGWVAARFALTQPDRLARLVLNTTGGSAARPEVMARIKELSQRAADSPTWEFIKARLEWLMADKAVVTDDLVATRQAIYASAGFGQAMRNALVLQEMDVRRRNLLADADWSRIAAPTLVLWTTHDPTNPVNEGHRIASLIPGASFAVMEHCGHWPQFEDADTFNRIHLAFLRGQDISSFTV